MNMLAKKIAAVKKQVIDWMNTILDFVDDDTDITNDRRKLGMSDLIPRCVTGTLLCKLAQKINEDDAKIYIPRINSKAKPRSILSHENVRYFLDACIGFGLLEQELFDQTSFVEFESGNYNERDFVCCILSLARLASRKYGQEPPKMVQAELFIKSLEKNRISDDNNTIISSNIDRSIKDSTGLSEYDNEQLFDSVQNFCILNAIKEPPKATSCRGEFLFGDGSRAHIRLFDAPSEDNDTSKALLVHSGDNWVDLFEYLVENNLIEKKQFLELNKVSTVSTANNDVDTASIQDIKNKDIDPISLTITIDTVNELLQNKQNEKEYELNEMRKELQSINDILTTNIKKIEEYEKDIEEQKCVKKNEVNEIKQRFENDIEKQRQENKEEINKIKQEYEEKIENILQKKQINDDNVTRMLEKYNQETKEYQKSQICDTKPNYIVSDKDTETIDTNQKSIDTQETEKYISIIGTQDIDSSHISRDDNDIRKYFTMRDFFYLTYYSTKILHPYGNYIDISLVEKMWDSAYRTKLPFYFYQLQISKTISSQALTISLKNNFNTIDKGSCDEKNPLRALRMEIMNKIQSTIPRNYDIKVPSDIDMCTVCTRTVS